VAEGMNFADVKPDPALGMANKYGQITSVGLGMPLIPGCASTGRYFITFAAPWRWRLDPPVPICRFLWSFAACHWLLQSCRPAALDLTRCRSKTLDRSAAGSGARFDGDGRGPAQYQ
jgi:hypothetical protein